MPEAELQGTAVSSSAPVAAARIRIEAAARTTALRSVPATAPFSRGEAVVVSTAGSARGILEGGNDVGSSVVVRVP
jgi:hypothetical protein